VLHLRLIVPPTLTGTVLSGLRENPGVAHLAVLPGGAVEPAGDIVLCDVVRESANELIEWLQAHDVHHVGAITVEALEAVVSDAAASAEGAAAGHGTDAVVWEELESKLRSEAELTASFLVFMSVASSIAAAGVLLDSPILVVGAMVVGPEYGPLAALCVALVRRRPGGASRACRTLALGFAAGAVAAFVSTVLFRLLGLTPDDYELGARQLTAFISRPDGMAVAVAILAGIVGMLSLTEARSGALIGVLVSVTTIPAIGNVGVAAAYGEWTELRGAAVQLLINVVSLVAAGVVTLAVQARLTARAGERALAS
jgi:uncharacterized hydrophobic protein (TIGR00271 family)